MKISVSDMGSFLYCRKQWDYGSVNRMNLEPIALKPALWLGRGVHHALEHFYRNDGDLVDLFALWAVDSLEDFASKHIEVDFDRDYELGLTMLANYQQYYGRTPATDRDGIQVLFTEQEFSIPVATRHGEHEFVGTIDGLCRDMNGRLWIVEHKTAARFPSEEELQYNPQHLAYMLAMQTMIEAEALLAPYGLPANTKVHGVLYNGLLKATPTTRTKADKQYFKRVWYRRTVDQIDMFANTLSAIFDEMTNPIVACYPSIQTACTSCSYARPCTTWQQGADEEYELRQNYAARPQRGFVYPVPTGQSPLKENQ